MRVSLTDLLKECSVSSSAPMRIDCGSTWDLPALALTQRSINPHTVNIAINHRVYVELLPFRKGEVCIESDEFGIETCKKPDYHYTSAYKVIFAALSFFNVSGVLVKIKSDLPAKLGFGGSASLIVSLVSALSKCLKILNLESINGRRDIAFLAYNLEKVFIQTGIQDHLAAAYGGVNRWNWNFGDFKNPYHREQLVQPECYHDLESRLSIAYSVEKHNSDTITSKWIDSFICNKTRKQWFQVNHYSNNFSTALSQLDWNKAIESIRQETRLRVCLDQEVLTKDTRHLVNISHKHKCAGRFVGAGYGGGVWAIGDKADILELKKAWSVYSKQNNNIFTISNNISRQGFIVDVKYK